MEKTSQGTINSVLTYKKIQKDNLLITTEGNSIIMKGTIDDQNPGSYLLPFLDSVHKNVLEKKISSIEIDIRNLLYINSSGIKDMISWLLKFDSMEKNHQYSITFLCDKKSRWQGLSIAMLQKIIPEKIYREFA